MGVRRDIQTFGAGVRALGDSTLPTPDSFLINGDINNAASSWDINTGSSAWESVLADPTLGIQVIESSGTALKLSSSRFWDLTFSNSSNQPIFGNTSPAVSLPSDGTVIGAVLGLVTPTGSPPDLAFNFGAVRERFGITDANSTALLKELVEAIDASGAVQVKMRPLSSITFRNALWAIPGPDAYRIAISLVFEFQTAGVVAKIQSLLNQYLGLSLSIAEVAPLLVLTAVTSYTVPGQGEATELTITSTYKMELRLELLSFEITMAFAPDGMSLAVSEKPSSSTTTVPIYERLSNEIGVGTVGTNSPKAHDIPDRTKSNPSAFDKLLSDVVLWYVQIGMDGQVSSVPGQPPSSPDLSSVYWKIGLLAKLQPTPGSEMVLAAITLDTRTGIYEGRLLFRGDGPSLNSLRQYDLETWMIPPSNINFTALGSSLDLASVFGNKKPPPQIPTQIKQALIKYSRAGEDGSGYTFQVQCLIDGSETPPSGQNANSAPSSIDLSILHLSLLVVSDGASTTADIHVLSSTILREASEDNPVPAILFVELEYSQDQFWRLEADAENIPIATISGHFDRSIQTKAAGAFGQLMLRDLHMLYLYNSEGEASSFLITAVVQLGKLELDLYYQYDSPLLESGEKSAARLAWGDTPPNQVTFLDESPTATWKFEAYLGAASPNSTMGDIVASIIGEDKAKGLPGFLSDIHVNAAGGGNSAVKLIMNKGSTGSLVLAFQIVLEDLNFTYATIWPSSQAGNTDSKIVLRVGVDKIPLLDSVPLIKELPQPFDKIEYLYVDDGGAGIGLTAEEVDGMINPLLPDTAPKFDYQKTNGPSSTVPAMRAGHHFMVVNKNEVVLDHVFLGTQPDLPPDPNPQGLVAGRVAGERDESTAQPDDSAPTKGKLDVQLPFLSIDAVTLKCKGLKLFVNIDGTVTLGPIKGSVIGFEIVLDLSKVRLNHLEKAIEDGAISFGIHGLSIAVDESPLMIAGVFIHDTQAGSAGQTIERYAGGVSVGFEEWQFLAVGAYQVITVAHGDGYKSVFVYAKLNGPLFTLGFATVSGVRAGFGYNSIVRSPSLIEMPKFPFLDQHAESQSAGDPMALLTSMMSGEKAWVTPKEDSYWVAAGLTLTAFGILSITAVLMLGFHDGGVVISVFADGIAQMPPDVGSDATLFYVEIFMLAELNTVEGYFTVQASLAPSSHILVPSCRLTGGFALANWFDPSPHSGDFVFTVGGFHPAYSPPAWYPVPARLGIAFTLGDMINVSGNCYFAITPKCVMGGGALHFGLDVGPVSAWLDMSLDVFIQFKPFHYIAEMKVSVGCAITIKVWFVRIRISASVGAQLHVEGPDPFGGVSLHSQGNTKPVAENFLLTCIDLLKFANVDFYLFSFTIHFGGSAEAPPALSLHDYYEMVKTPGPSSTREGTTTPDASTSRLKFLLTDGIYTAGESSAHQANEDFPDAGANAIWDTKAGAFGCSIDCDFALLDAHLVTVRYEDPNTPDETDAILAPTGESVPSSLFSKPMHATTTSTITSTLEVLVWQIHPDGSKTLYKGSYHFMGSLVMKDVPAALWSPYEASADPMAPGSASSPPALKDSSGATVRLPMGVKLVAPFPLLYPGLAATTFDPSVAFRMQVTRLPGDEGGGDPWEMPSADPLQDTHLASEEVYASLPPEERWDRFRETWDDLVESSSGIVGGQLDSDGVPTPGLIIMAATTLGWDIPTPSSVLMNSGSAVIRTPPAPSGSGAGGASGTAVGPSGASTRLTSWWLLSAKAPSLLIQSVKSAYPVLPRYSVP